MSVQSFSSVVADAPATDSYDGTTKRDLLKSSSAMATTQRSNEYSYVPKQDTSNTKDAQQRSRYHDCINRKTINAIRDDGCLNFEDSESEVYVLSRYKHRKQRYHFASGGSDFAEGSV